MVCRRDEGVVAEPSREVNRMSWFASIGETGTLSTVAKKLPLSFLAPGVIGSGLATSRSLLSASPDELPESRDEYSSSVRRISRVAPRDAMRLTIARKRGLRFAGVWVRLKRHFGTLARAISHLITFPQRRAKPSPPPHSSAFRMIDWGERDANARLISATDRSSSSAGRRLVVVKYCKVVHRAWCKG